MATLSTSATDAAKRPVLPIFAVALSPSKIRVRLISSHKELAHYFDIDFSNVK